MGKSLNPAVLRAIWSRLAGRGVGVKRDIKDCVNQRLTQFKDLISIMLVVAIAIMAYLGFYFNFVAFQIGRVGIFNFFISLLYILTWVIFLLWCVRVKSLLLLKLYLIFWSIEVLYFVLYEFVVLMQLSYSLFMLFFIATPVFLVPLMGFDMLYQSVRNDLNIDTVIIFLPFLIVSVIMFAAGLVARKVIRWGASDGT